MTLWLQNFFKKKDAKASVTILHRTVRRQQPLQDSPVTRQQPLLDSLRSKTETVQNTLGKDYFLNVIRTTNSTHYKTAPVTRQQPLQDSTLYNTSTQQKCGRMPTTCQTIKPLLWWPSARLELWNGSRLVVDDNEIILYND